MIGVSMSQFLSPPPNHAPVAIYNDGGGLVENYIQQAYKYRLEGRAVQIRGSCRSACLMALSVPKVCVSPGAVVKAHHAYEQNTGKVREDYTSRMLSELPSSIRNKLNGKITVAYNPEATLDYAELRKLGVSDCGNTKVTASDKPRNVTFKFISPIDIINRMFPMFRK